MTDQRPVGVLNINKPSGLTSRKVVDRVSLAVKPAKAGHAGTLDPLATGVLIVCVGPATRLIRFVQQLKKVYRATFQLGVRSNTDDIDGQVEVGSDPGAISEVDIKTLLKRFVGTIEQVPPAFSAVHINGQRAYKLARKGRNVELPARPVTVHDIQFLSFEDNRIQLGITCGSGTYIRSIGRDMGNELGCGAIMTALQRTAIGKFTVEDAVEMESIEAESICDQLHEPKQVVEHLIHHQCSKKELALLRNGCLLPCENPYPTESSAEQSIALMFDEQLAAIARYDEEKKGLQPKQVFIEVGQ